MFEIFVRCCLQETYPHPDHKMTNGAIPGTHSGYMCLCVRWHVPENVDLVVVRYLPDPLSFYALSYFVIDLVSFVFGIRFSIIYLCSKLPRRVDGLHVQLESP